MPRVCIIQEPVRWDAGHTAYRPVYDLSPAAAWGTPEFLLPPGDPPLDPVATLPALRTKLAGFSHHDYLLLIGHPLLIAWASIEAARAAGGLVQFLHWHRAGKRYIATATGGFNDFEESEDCRAAAR